MSNIDTTINETIVASIITKLKKRAHPSNDGTPYQADVMVNEYAYAPGKDAELDLQAARELHRLQDLYCQAMLELEELDEKELKALKSLSHLMELFRRIDHAIGPEEHIKDAGIACAKNHAANGIKIIESIWKNK